MSGIVLDHLRALYGESAAPDITHQLESLLERWRKKLPATERAASRAESSTLSERDALLITYADQVSAPEETPLRTLGDFADRHLHDVVSGIHVLPFYPWSSDDGFSVKDYYAVDPAFGTWDDVRRLGQHFELMFDAVFNHMSAQSEWFRKFLTGDPPYDDFFVTVTGEPDLSQVIRPRALPLLTDCETHIGKRRVWTTFSADQVDLNVRNPAVLLALIDVLLFYVSQGARFIRLDAIAFFWKEIGTNCLHLPQTHRIIQLMRSVLEEIAPRTQLITETNVPHVDNLSYFGDGTNEAHLVYNFALPPLVLHTLAIGDATKLTLWARSLELPSDRVALFNFLASHDGIGLNPARGILSSDEIDALVARTLRHGGFISYKHLPDRSQQPYEMNINFFDALSDPTSSEPLDAAVARTRCAHAIQLALAGVPGIYFHSLFGSRGDRAGAETSGIARRINRQKLTRDILERDLTDSASLRHRVFTGLRALLQVRRAHSAFHPTAPQEILSLDPRLFVVHRSAHDHRETVLCVHNVSAERVTLPLPPIHSSSTVDASTEVQSRILIGAPDCVLPGSGAGAERLSLTPHAVAWLRYSSA